MFLAPGATLDNYEVIAPLAVGGIAERYVARARGIEKLCVLERILPQHARDAGLVQMFLDEARLAATLHHPNIVEVYGIGAADAYVAREYVHGQDLAAIIAAARSRGMKLEHAIAIVAAVAAGLHHAHEQLGPSGDALDIVHRDVSPTTILVSYDGTIKIVDFGIAKLATVAKGKLPYLSPEQVRGDRRLDRRSDIYSLGSVLYELTTGYPLFEADSDDQLAALILSNQIVRPTAARDSYPKALEDIVMTALAPDPADRFATARDLQLALESFARARQLRYSSVGLAEYMSSLFPSQVGGWDLARRSGRSLIEYVTSTMVSSSQVTRRAQHVSWLRRWAPALALVALTAAFAAWILVFSQRTTGPEAKPGPAATAPTAGGVAAPAGSGAR